jgi:hypothetical protein
MRFGLVRDLLKAGQRTAPRRCSEKSRAPPLQLPSRSSSWARLPDLLREDDPAREGARRASARRNPWHGNAWGREDSDEAACQPSSWPLVQVPRERRNRSSLTRCPSVPPKEKAPAGEPGLLPAASTGGGGDGRGRHPNNTPREKSFPPTGDTLPVSAGVCRLAHTFSTTILRRHEKTPRVRRRVASVQAKTTPNMRGLHGGARTGPLLPGEGGWSRRCAEPEWAPSINAYAPRLGRSA